MHDFENEIKTDSEYKSIYQLLTFKSFPNTILCKVMNVFEKYRMNHKYGWSRPWNKENLTIFKSFRWYPFEDEDIYILVVQFLLQNINIFDENSEDFVRDLLNDRKIQAFMFFHDSNSHNSNFEGITISLGRISSRGSRFRDRVDIILEANVCNKISSKKLDKVRIISDPYLGSKKFPNPIFITDKDIKNFQLLEKLLEISINKFLHWKGSEREWHHWSQKYIYYFGERKNEPINSLFFNKIYLAQKNTIHSEIKNI